MEKYQKQLLKKENEIVKANKIFCSRYNIVWGWEHDLCLKNAMRAFFLEGVYPIVEEIFKDKKVLVRKPLVEAEPLKAHSKNTPLKKGKRG